MPSYGTDFLYMLLLFYFEAYFAMSYPQFSVRPKLRLYSKVNELFSKSKVRKAKLRGNPTLFTGHFQLLKS